MDSESKPQKRRGRRAAPGTARFQDAGVKTDFTAATEEFKDSPPVADRGGLVPAGGNPNNAEDTRKRTKILAPIRLGKRWSEILAGIDAKEFTWAEFVQTLTPTELARGQLMDKNGEFRGRPPSLVPRAFHDACIRELMARGKVLYQENYIAAIESMTEIAKNTNAKESDRIKAAQFVIERLEGKAVERLVVTAEDPFAAMMEGAVASLEEDAAIANAQDYLDRIHSQGDNPNG